LWRTLGRIKGLRLFLLLSRRSGRRCGPPIWIALAGVVIIRRQIVLPYVTRLVVDHWVLAIRIRRQVHGLSPKLGGQGDEYGRQSLLVEWQWGLLLGHLLRLNGSWRRLWLGLLLHGRFHRLLGLIWSKATRILGRSWQGVWELKGIMNNH